MNDARFPLDDLRIGFLRQDKNFLVFSTGKVYSLLYQRFISTSLDRKGYPRFTVKDKETGKTINIKVHTAVIETFYGPRPEGLECAHLDGDKLNANLNNLRYVTRAENAAHKKDHGTAFVGEKHPNSKLTIEDVAYIRANYRLLGPRKSNSGELARQFGVSQNYIGHIIRKYNWSDTPRKRPHRSKEELAARKLKARG